jgi:uncharacterized C2H2 Zn-finger protein
MTVEPASRAEADAVRCDTCGRVFDDRDRLLDHLEASHSVVTNAVEEASTPVRVARD